MIKTIKKTSAGKQGDNIRSDCYFEIELKNSGGIKLDIKSKVQSMYGESIKEMILEMSKFFGIKDAKILCEDYGALPFVMAARFELAIKRLFPENKKEYLLPFIKQNQYSTKKDQLRRSRLYLPGNEPKFFMNAGLHSPDGIILDLEDSVAPTEKDAAQLLVRNVLRSVDFYNAERMVRINQLPKGLDDLKYIIQHNVNVILVPKCESAEQIKQLEKEVDKLKKQQKVNNAIYFMPIIESALGVIKAYEIATASKNNCALAIGLEDYTADIGTQRTNEGRESIYARQTLVNAAKAAGIQAIDTVFSDVSDMEALRQSVLEAKSLGFEGKGCIHPRQIKVVHDAFAPTTEEIEKAKKIVLAFEEAEKKGLGVVSLGSKMIDPPVVKRAQRTIELAILNNLLDKNWKKQ
ncbi:MAG: HpcH/HpaI aldolase/citrate lyase family protein [Ignavibacteriota bacterium]|nr:MAG: citrate lyase ACP [Chlorobiota bacterium]MBE7477546.1 HpcH/HpaI aldolase/citrate lyase family protein [Ignavibacteriales bacterium]MBL1123940.1 citrate lyase ACP [Ignavibacteriota bacterium]MCC7093069.1 HpcH/HpaI aldolase/citrate lyase family protein [Ignavibacteriaceae bacterium]MCE7857305.1 citrate lyase ACP [Ignavibacteria bacterium CHB3]MEB2295283.1 aldolase/citrate lyase family protein [Ignavibacteria bacterium]